MSESRYHGAGFLQVKINDLERIHIWHPDIPSKMHDGLIHDHNFTFQSKILQGKMTLKSYEFIEDHKHGPQRLWPVAPKDMEDLVSMAQWNSIDSFPGKAELVGEYTMEAGVLPYMFEMYKLHEIVPDGIVVTHMTKLQQDPAYWPRAVSDTNFPPDDAYPAVPYYSREELDAILNEVTL